MQDEYEEVNGIHDKYKGIQIFSGYLLQQSAERHSRKIVIGQIVSAGTNLLYEIMRTRPLAPISQH